MSAAQLHLLLVHLPVLACPAAAALLIASRIAANETLLKMEITNVTHFPIRRIDLEMRLPYQTDLDVAREVLLDVADQHPLVLDEPRPFLLFMGFGEFALNVKFSLWATREHVIDVRNTVPELIKDAFDAAGIDVPYPRSVVTYRQDAAPPKPD